MPVTPPALRANSIASSMSTSTMRDTPGSCMVTPISWLRHFHGDLVVGDEQELRLARHLLHQLAEALGVGVVQRRVDLVQQAERRRIQLEQREHQRDRGERLFAAREQLDRLVLLARRRAITCRPASRISSPVSCRLRLAAAEQRREHFAEMLVDRHRRCACSRSRVSRSMRLIAASSVSIACGQVERLRVEEVLPLPGRRSAPKRRQVDRAQRRDLLVQARDLAWQATRNASSSPAARRVPRGWRRLPAAACGIARRGSPAPAP